MHFYRKTKLLKSWSAELLKYWLTLALIFLLPTQLGHFFFINASYISGIKIDYLAPVLYLTDILVIAIIILNSRLPRMRSIAGTVFQDPSSSLKKMLKFFGVAQNKLFLHFNNSILYSLLSILFILNIVYAISPIISFYKYLKVLEVLAIFFIFKNSKISSKNILVAFLAGAVFQLVLILGQIYSQQALQGIFYFFGERAFSISTPGIAKISMQGVEVLRGYGTFSHPNSMGGFYLLLYAFILYFPMSSHFKKEKYSHPDPEFSGEGSRIKSRFFVPLSRSQNDKNINLIKYILLSVCMLLIFLSFSKIAIIGLLVLIIFGSLKEKTDCLVCKASHLIVPLVLAFVFLSGQGDMESFDKRIWLAGSSLEIIKDHIFFGTGLGNYLIAQSKFPIPYSYFFLQPVHNIFLLLISELGVPLFCLLSYFLIKMIRFFLRTSGVRNRNAWMIALSVIIFTGFFDHYWLTLQQNILLVPLVFGLLQRDKTVVK